jgi:hypothetical protein
MQIVFFIYYPQLQLRKSRLHPLFHRLISTEYTAPARGGRVQEQAWCWKPRYDILTMHRTQYN